MQQKPSVQDLQAFSGKKAYRKQVTVSHHVLNVNLTSAIKK